MSSHIKTIDGKKYYVQEDGTVKKNFAVELNGKILYFDAETGALIDSAEYQFQQGTSISIMNSLKRMLFMVQRTRMSNNRRLPDSR